MKTRFSGAGAALALTAALVASPAAASPSAEVLTADGQKALTPAAALAELKAGNERFVAGKGTPRDYLGQAAATASGQYPKAIVLGCVDSRVPPEIVFDQGIGDIFAGRIAGNFENEDLLGSIEFATKLAGSRVVVVLGHTACGAVKGAIDRAELGHLTGMLGKLESSVAAAAEATDGERASSNHALVDAAVHENVRQTVRDILERSDVVRDMVDAGNLLVVGGVYDLKSGRVEWLES